MTGLGWILLWVLPWRSLPTIPSGSLLAIATDMLRLAIALGMFVYPGILLVLLLRPSRDRLKEPCGLIPVGFTMSTLLIGVVGLVGRITGASFSAVLAAFVVLGVMGLYLIGRSAVPGPNPWPSLRAVLWSIVSNPPLMAALLLSCLLMFQSPLFFIDDLSYLAYLTSWQHSEHLGFQNLVYGVEVAENPRFWLALYPMGQALLSHVSGLPGILLLGSYLEFFLVPIAVIAAFTLARELGLSNRAAGFAVLIQISLYVWMIGQEFPVGMWFYQNMAEDKVTAALILAPVFFVFTVQYLKRPARASLALILLSATAMALTHPVSQFFACLIGAAVALCSLLAGRTEWRTALAAAGASGASLLPSAFIRYSSSVAELGIPFDGAAASTSYQITRYTDVLSGTFYGLNVDVLRLVDLPLTGGAYGVYQVVRWLPVVIAGLGGLFAIARFRQGPLYWYIISCLALVGLATLPYTGWVLGQFVSARLINRSSWFLPLGLAGVLIIQSLAGARFKRPRRSERDRASSEPNRNREIVGIVLAAVFTSLILAYASIPRIPEYLQRLDHDKQLAAVGSYIDHDTDAPVTAIALTYADTQLLPGISANARVISFREEVLRNPHNYMFPRTDTVERIRASNILRAGAQTRIPGEPCASSRKFGLRFVVADRGSAAPYADALERCGQGSEVAFTTRDLVLLELK